MNANSTGGRPVDRVLARLYEFGEVAQHNGYKMAVCPAHFDSNPSLSVKEGDDGKALLKCFAGCAFEDVVKALGLEQKACFPDTNVTIKPKRGRGGEGVYTSSENRRTLEPGCTLEAYSEYKNLPIDFLKEQGVSEIPNYSGHPAVRFLYVDAQGEELCVRFRVSLEGTSKVKTRRGDKHALYGSWWLEEARERDYVIVVEGESDCHTLWHHNNPAVGVPGAASWRDEWASHLDGIEHIYAIVEPDEGGEKLWAALSSSPIRERLYKVVLPDGIKDASALHLGPGSFTQQLGEALNDAVSCEEIIEAEVEAESREAWAKCEDLAEQESILDLFAVDIKRAGLAGDTRAAKLLYLALNTRHLDTKQLVNCVLKGPSAAGKSYTAEQVLKFYPEDAYHLLTAMSEKLLAYTDKPLAHKFLVLAEAPGMSGEFASYLIRSLLSEGYIRYEYVEKTSEGLRPRSIVKEGPTGLIVTTTKTKLHSENETRMLSVTVDDTPKHTKEILQHEANERRKVFDPGEWQALQTWLDSGERRVTIPYSKQLAELIPSGAIRLRRDFKALLNLIRSHALLHRATRERDERGQIVATIQDYAAVRELVEDLISEGIEATVNPIVRETVEKARELLDADDDRRPIRAKAIGDALGLEKGAYHRRVQMALDAGYLENLEDRKGRPARLVKGDDLPEDVPVLPKPEDLDNGSTVLRFREEVKDPPPPLSDESEDDDDEPEWIG